MQLETKMFYRFEVCNLVFARVYQSFFFLSPKKLIEFLISALALRQAIMKTELEKSLSYQFINWKRYIKIDHFRICSSCFLQLQRTQFVQC